MFARKNKGRKFASNEVTAPIVIPEYQVSLVARLRQLPLLESRAALAS